MEPTKKRFKATIADRTYTIIGNKSSQHMETVTSLVNEKLNQLTEVSPTLSLQEKTILLTVNIMSDLLDQQLMVQQTQKQLQEMERELLTLRRQLSKQKIKGKTPEKLG